MLNQWMRKWMYSLWYLRRPPWDTGVTPPEVMAHLAINPPGRALDLGCGTGTNAITLAQHGWRVVAVDFVGRAIQTARRKARQAGVDVEFHQGDVTRLEHIEGPFDLVLDIGCLHSIPADRRTAYVDTLTRLLAVDGTFLVYAFTNESGQSSIGLTADDLDLLNSRLKLAERQDGLDGGQRSSAWFRFVG